MSDPMTELARMAATSYRDPLWRPDVIHYDDEGAPLDAEAHPHLMVLSRVAITLRFGKRLPEPRERVIIHNVLPGSIIAGGDGATMCGRSLHRLYAELGPDGYRSARVADGPTTCGECQLLAAHRVRAHFREVM